MNHQCVKNAWRFYNAASSRTLGRVPFKQAAQDCAMRACTNLYCSLCPLGRASSNYILLYGGRLITLSTELNLSVNNFIIPRETIQISHFIQSFISLFFYIYFISAMNRFFQFFSYGNSLFHPNSLSGVFEVILNLNLAYV